MESNMQTMPLVSIIIPVYNGSNYVREAIEGALHQTYSRKEIIVINDGSNDHGETEKIVKAYGDKVRYIYKENGGVSSALNVGIREMKGEFFSWLSHDDVYYPKKIESQVEEIMKYPGEKLIALCGTKQIDSMSNDLKTVGSRKTEQTTGVLLWEDALKTVIHNGSFCGCALLIPRKAFEDAGLFDESLRYSQDLLMWIKIFLSRYGLLRTPGIHVGSRVHEKQLTQTGKALFHKDSRTMGIMLLPDLAENSTLKDNFLLEYTLYNAKYNNPDVVDMYIKEGKKRRLLTGKDIVKIHLTAAYGRIRPFIRNVYYRVFRGMTTQS